MCGPLIIVLANCCSAGNKIMSVFNTGKSKLKHHRTSATEG